MLGVRNATFPDFFVVFWQSEAKLFRIGAFAKKLKDFP